MPNFGGVIVTQSLMRPRESLAGIVGTHLEVEQYITQLAGTTGKMLVPATPGRTSLIVEWAPTAIGYLYVSFVSAGASQNHMIDPGGTFQIDQNFPWTGNVELSTRVATAVGYVEISELRIY